MIQNLPPNWRMARLGDCLSRRKQTVMPSTLTDDLINVVGLEDIEAAGSGIISIQQKKPSEVESLKTIFQKGDILYGKLRPYLNKVAITPESGFCSTEIWAFATETFIHPYFAFAFLSSPMFVQRASAMTKGANLPRLDAESFDSIELPLPPLSEQQRIVEMLREARQVRHLCSTAEQKTLEIIPAFFRVMFLKSDKRNRWPEVKVEQIVASTDNSIRTGPFGSDLLHSEFVSEGTPVLGIDNVVQNRFRWGERRFITPTKYKELKRFRVFPDDVMITIMGTVGRVAIAPRDLPESISSKHLCVVTPDLAKVFAIFLWAVLLFDPHVRAQAKASGKGAVMEGWNSKIIRSLRFRLPPIELQKRFSALASEVFALEELLPPSYNKADAITRSLFSNAFTGELTAEWRERNKYMLKEEAAARDEALAARGVMLPRPSMIQEIEEMLSHRTEGAYAELTREQHILLEAIERGYGGVTHPRWFTAEDVAKYSLSGPLRGNPQVIENHLAVLAARGLIVPISREEQRPDTGAIVYGNAYRLRLRDFEPVIGDPREPVIGDDARLREMERLANQLEKRPMP